MTNHLKIFFFLVLTFYQLNANSSPISGNNIHKSWWNVLFYNITIEPIIEHKYLKGTSEIHLKKINKTKDYILQLDLQSPIEISEISIDFINLKKEIKSIKLSKELIAKKTNYYLLYLSGYKNEINNSETILKIKYSGFSKIAQNPPWKGGWVFSKDKNNNHFVSVACQSDGASLWYPCKDYWGDEPENGAQLNIITPNNLVGVGNGKLINKEILTNNKINYSWKVNNPINPYNIVPYIGKYENFSEIYKGKKGDLTLDFWVLEENLEKAKIHFKQVHSMLKCFEEKLGPYPFYEDSFKLVEAPYVGMEHQSNIAYGNQYKNGYYEKDISGTGHGLNWDYIIVHESGHEWFLNSITGKNISDKWIHESFTTYSEVIYTSFLNGKKAGDEYVQGLRNNIENKKPILNKSEPDIKESFDMYSKGANIIHTFKQLIKNDDLFFQLLNHLTKTLHNKTINSKEFINVINQFTHKNYTSFFNQYLKTTSIPILLYKKKKNNLYLFKWDNSQEFPQNFQLKLKNGQWIFPSSNRWKSILLKNDEVFEIDNNFYIEIKNEI